MINLQKERHLANIMEAMSLWIDTAGELGWDIPQPLGRRLMYA